jgi:hypothetical protein
MFTQFHVQSFHTSTTANGLATNCDILLFSGTNDEDEGGEKKEEGKKKTHFCGRSIMREICVKLKKNG